MRTENIFTTPFLISLVITVAFFFYGIDDAKYISLVTTIFLFGGMALRAVQIAQEQYRQYLIDEDTLQTVERHKEHLRNNPGERW